MTKTRERRELSFSSLDEAISDAERLAHSEVRTTGNHSFGQILKHLALSLDMATGEIIAPRPPIWMRMMMPFMKGMILNGPAKPGFKLPKKSESFFWPAEPIDAQEAMAHFKKAAATYNAKGPLPVHPVFGEATREQNDRLNITHCSMHLSFVHPV